MATSKLRDNEQLCKFDGTEQDGKKHECKTIVEKSIGSCEMCCPAAVAERSERLVPIIAKDIEEAEKRDLLNPTLHRKKNLPSAELADEAALEEATKPAPKSAKK